MSDCQELVYSGFVPVPDDIEELGDSNPVAKYSNSSKSAVRAQTGSWSWKPYTYESKQVCDSELRFIRPGMLWKSTDLGSQIGIFGCGNLKIFLPLWFYVKSILADFRRSKTVVLTILQALNFDFWKNLTLEMSKVPKNSIFKAAQLVQMAVFGGFKMTKIDFT